MTMTWNQQNALAHKMGAFYENGRWYFPSPASAREFERKVAGQEELPDGAVMEDLQGNFYDANGERLS